MDIRIAETLPGTLDSFFQAQVLLVLFAGQVTSSFVYR
jgi:hypothetical protein